VNIIGFHEKCMLVIIFVLIVVLFILAYKIFRLKSVLKKLENQIFEIAWTLFPTLIILGIMIPSLELLYFSEETGGAKKNNKIKIVGHQWYWSYENNNGVFSKPLIYDSYLVKEENLKFGEFRKSEVDLPLFFKVNESVRLLITSADSIHSWAIPEFGVKVDAIPGRLNQVVIFSQEVGRFFGFCSELCGVNHSFMPIVVEVLKPSTKWKTKKFFVDLKEQIIRI
jgi:heme/copper-type cytochrome/quinol oxidase subunit 2